MKMNRFKIGNIVYSQYFSEPLRITRIDSNEDWWFMFVNYPSLRPQKAQTPLSYFESSNSGWETMI
jgi:hypothetical protein